MTRTSERLRPRSVRAKIVALLMLPVVSLMALWSFAAVTTASTIGDAERAKEVNSELLAPVADFVTAIQTERTAAARYAGAPGSGDSDVLTRTQVATDKAVDALLDGVNSTSSDAALLNSALPDRLDRLTDDAKGLTALRASVSGDGNAKRTASAESHASAAYTAYTGYVEDAFAVTGALTGEKGTTTASEARVVLELSRAREAVAQEQALLAAGTAAGKLTGEQYALFVGAVAVQRGLLKPAVADLRPEHQKAYNELLQSGGYRQLTETENRVRSAGAGESAVGDGLLRGWDNAASSVLRSLDQAETEAGTAAAAKANPFGWATLGASGIAVVLGLVGVLLSLLVSVSVGRGLILELLHLRNSALEVAGRRLPQAMRRLHAGQGVDIDAEAPLRRLAGDELAQVGTALTAVQRAALKAASERAELLSGISGVYVSLARRSQVLLHRQLDILDQLEQRPRDPAELHALYRVDYLATRMRRHSESLLILSGIAPGRGWRDPIPLADTLRAAVSEIEDASRVQIWSVPRVSLNGGSVADVIHLLAELVENGASFSPPSTKVRLRAARLSDGVIIEVEDSGFGMNDDAMADANRKLRSEKVDLLDAKQIGLFVVNRIAARQGLRVELRDSPNGGVTAAVLIPENLLRDDMPAHGQEHEDEYEYEYGYEHGPSAPADGPDTGDDHRTLTPATPSPLMRQQWGR
ncbi:nitrate- and nitrite sensing domain-containing protein [Streptomyces sp. AK08-02]|uniref:sensor histidine kinase n=1 Tax=Streptomyces sp. AK08-02 TaxID=3028654 RepID=UPI0029B7B283|nr:nitrate- and nitrite sensing domain-containing protein [Streptomyces sp. AK08-02]MDX3750558.1 nitrate- and nitrite sensing domain-containing protein [Streptomyces sp. AK08-02]